METVRVAPSRLSGFATRLGARLVAITNHVVSRGDATLRVNVLVAASDAGAGVLLDRLAALHRGEAPLARRGRSVVEIHGEPAEARQALKEGLGLLDRAPRRYRVKLRLALLEDGDQAAVNRVFYRLVTRRQGRIQPLAPGELRRMTAGLRFGATLSLRRPSRDGVRAAYVLTPPPSETEQAGSFHRYRFAAPARLEGVPYVDVVATVGTRGFTPLPAARPPGESLRAATSSWPTGAPEVRATLAALTLPEAPAARLRAVHGWVHRTIRYGGPTGGRAGTLHVLRRRLGQCWELADVLVTLARAAGLPARQVAGWVPHLGGHVWAEVWLPSEGWVAVDATAPWIGVGGDYIPLMTTEDGRMPVFHLAWPAITRLE